VTSALAASTKASGVAVAVSSRGAAVSFDAGVAVSSLVTVSLDRAAYSPSSEDVNAFYRASVRPCEVRLSPGSSV